MEIVVKLEVPDDDKKAVSKIAAALGELDYNIKNIGEEKPVKLHGPTYRGPAEDVANATADFVGSKIARR